MPISRGNLRIRFSSLVMRSIYMGWCLGERNPDQTSLRIRGALKLFFPNKSSNPIFASVDFHRNISRQGDEDKRQILGIKL
ncbi:hypothetical protein MKW98_015919 [Papaver atlanticum]|uniref:Uncharacterized protein n=1 Tax=Papaver atlanticum TaxID=357466 RepID=A0AAD4S939_9MAGN|nr:hypothetical protein MKW98_015919 [Papaver atlanticum]